MSYYFPAFGRTDTRAQRALAAMRANFFVSEHLDGIGRANALDHLDREYISKGRDIFDPRSITGEMLDEFRQAAGGIIDGLSDAKVRAIITFATQRVRTYGNITQLRQGRYKWAKVVSDLGIELPICEALNGTFFRVTTAAKVLEDISALSIADQGHFVCQILQLGKSPAFVHALRSEIAKLIIPESLTERGFAIPPLHEMCGCRIDGVDKEEVEDSRS